MPTPEHYLTEPTAREVAYGAAKIARHVRGDLWEVFFAPGGRAGQREGTALSDDVRRKQRVGSFEAERLEQILRDLA